MSDIERIPSMRKAARQGVPKRKPREMAKPTESGKTKDAPKIAPRAAALPPTVPEEPMPPEERMPPEEPMPPVEPTLALELELAAEPVFEGLPPPVPIYQPEREPEPEPELVLQPEPDPPPQPSAPASAQSAPSPAPAAPPPAPPAAPAESPHFTLRQLTARVDAAFAEFRAAAIRYPAEHMDDHLAEDAWTRKQMLAHIAAWHDLTSERLIKMTLTGRPVPLDRDPEAINAAAARVAVGKTAGEVLKDMEATFARLRRQMLRLTDAQLHADDNWAAQKIAANTYEHYAEHIADLAPPDPFVVNGARR